jgi:hypothetical protein
LGKQTHTDSHRQVDPRYSHLPGIAGSNYESGLVEVSYKIVGDLAQAFQVQASWMAREFFF